jgi:integrase
VVLTTRAKAGGGFEWHIDKRIRIMDDFVKALEWAEQDLFFGQLTEHLRDMAEFDVNTGLRDQELCGLQWAW